MSELSSPPASPADPLAAPAAKVERLLYHIVVTQGPRVQGRAYLNDIPVYEDPPTPAHQSTSSRANNFLVPGTNVLRIEVDSMGEPHDSIFFAQMFRDPDENEKLDRFHVLQWPDAMLALPVRPPVPVPFVAENLFTIEESHPRPYYEKVESEDVPLGGTDELRAAVKEFHDALVARDPVKMTELTWFEAEDSARYYPHLPPPQKATIGSTYAGGFQDPWDVPKWDPDRLLFTKRAGGRLVHVTGLDGRHAVTGHNTRDPEAHFVLNPLLVRHQGRWQLYR